MVHPSPRNRYRHAAGAYAWTFRADDVPAPFPGRANELASYFRLGVNGVFADHPDEAVRVRKAALPRDRCPEPG